MRLGNRASRAEMIATIKAVAGRFEATYPNNYTNESLEAIPLRTVLDGRYDRSLFAGLAGVLFVLLVAVATVAPSHWDRRSDCSQLDSRLG